MARSSVTGARFAPSHPTASARPPPFPVSDPCAASPASSPCSGTVSPTSERRLEVMNDLSGTAAPTTHGTWVHPAGHVGLRPPPARASSTSRTRPPADGRRSRHVGSPTTARSTTTPSSAPSSAASASGPTATPRSCCAAYDRWGPDSLDRLRGMFAYAHLGRAAQELFCARDRFGIKPFYYAVVGDVLYFASEAKALLPFLPGIETDLEASRTTSPSSSASPARRCSRACASCCPATGCASRNGTVATERYWEVYYDLDLDHTEPLLRGADRGAAARVRAAAPAQRRPRRRLPERRPGLEHGRLARERCTAGRADEGLHRPIPGGRALRRERVCPRARRRARAGPARDRHRRRGLPRSIERVVYHLDYPAAGPGSFPQFMVSQAAAARVQGDPRRPGRRRGLRRLHALPHRLLRAVHQGGDRRHDAQRQLRRHVRVDHPESRVAARTTSRC